MQFLNLEKKKRCLHLKLRNFFPSRTIEKDFKKDVNKILKEAEKHFYIYKVVLTKKHGYDQV
jgi:hypothetical protein